MFYKKASDSERLIITGLGIEGIKLEKTALVLPGQKCSRLNVSKLSYYNYEVQVDTIFAEDNEEEKKKVRLNFIVTFFIKPNVEDAESLMKYARFMLRYNNDKTQADYHVKRFLNSTVQNSTLLFADTEKISRDIVTSDNVATKLTTRNNLEKFKKELREKVGIQLMNDFGMLIDGAVVKQELSILVGPRYKRMFGIEV